MRMVGYTRRSKANRRKPDDPAHGIAAQRAAITAEAERRGWDVVWTEPDDRWTGANTRRPGLTTALDMLARGDADGLVVAKLNRLSRSVADFAGLLRLANKEKWSMVALDLGIDTSTINGRLVANIVMSVAEWERDIIAERTTEALAEAREAGVRLGRPPAVPDHTIRRVRELRNAGMTLRAVAEQLTADRVPTGHGAPSWRVSSVRGVLLRSGGDG